MEIAVEAGRGREAARTSSPNAVRFSRARGHRTVPDPSAEPIRAETYEALIAAVDRVYPGKWRRSLDVCPVAVNKTIDCEADAQETIRRIRSVPGLKSWDVTAAAGDV